MSKAVKLCIIILFLLVVASLGYCGYLLFVEKPKLEAQIAQAEKNLADSQKRETKSLKKIKKLEENLKKEKEESDKANKKLKLVRTELDTVNKEIKKVKSEKERTAKKILSVRRERDKLVEKVQQLNDQLSAVEKKSQSLNDRLKQATVAPRPEPQPQPQGAPTTAVAPPQKIATPIVPKDADESYWAGILREKAELEVKIANLNDELSKNYVKVVEMQQSNDNLNLELKNYKNMTDELENEIKYKGDLINNLSLELARTRNDKKFVSNRLEKLNIEGKELRSQIKQLISTKGSLEKSIVKLTQDKNQMERSLGQTESLIQSKIDEIWEIKDSIDNTFQSRVQPNNTNEIELPPIHVNAAGGSSAFPDMAHVNTQPGLGGKVVSINEENNFIIVNLGERSGIRVGDTLSVHRGSKFIARLEVIQVRKDIAAADIKDQWSNIQVGDAIR